MNPRRMLGRYREVDFGDGLRVPVFFALRPDEPVGLMHDDQECFAGMGAIVAQEARNVDSDIQTMLRCACSAAPLTRGQFVECACGHKMPQTTANTVPIHTRRRS
jgi:hypothetical protein